MKNSITDFQKSKDPYDVICELEDKETDYKNEIKGLEKQLSLSEEREELLDKDLEELKEELHDIKLDLKAAQELIEELNSGPNKEDLLFLLSNWLDCFTGESKNPLKDLKQLIAETRKIV